ncbi:MULTISPECIES: hypothetical protein [Edwardsiella]|uniref:Lipoprotein n=2 Tax=Edwardsiella anguillarum TaxID=1821960 RepID=A0A076LFE1_9GAMM|nr:MULTISPECIES: hypothetical protein [Edwardsiella]AIJ07250.1 Hypothetical protein ETEE_0779 [Edwardsiella anguillarum ET080813]AKR78587.1 hypothetical protein AAZ33_14145 [Edwardsiella sp. LADL05-105]KAB0590905.1 hypothetical protein F7P84_10725 [Edwardsiella anguillarum]UOU78358.1 hypothetical protein MUN71_15125 [Edwardsiella anguillarum]WHP83129.1 hypothetical protein MQ095_15275 [Edwardsiella anguillarum]
MKKTTLGKFFFIAGASVLLSACGGVALQPYAAYGTPVNVIAPAGQYSEWHTDSRSHTTGDSHTQSQGSCTQSEDSVFSDNGVTRTRQSNCNNSSQTHSSSTTKSRSSSVGFSVGGPIGASLGLIKQMETINRPDNNTMGNHDMFKKFGF